MFGTAIYLIIYSVVIFTCISHLYISSVVFVGSKYTISDEDFNNLLEDSALVVFAMGAGYFGKDIENLKKSQRAKIVIHALYFWAVYILFTFGAIRFLAIEGDLVIDILVLSINMLLLIWGFLELHKLSKSELIQRTLKRH